MPLYEFFCSDCREKIEELCSSKIKSICCPHCGKEAGKIFSVFRTGNSSAGGGADSSGCGG